MIFNLMLILLVNQIKWSCGLPSLAHLLNHFIFFIPNLLTTWADTTCQLHSFTCNALFFKLSSYFIDN